MDRQGRTHGPGGGGWVTGPHPPRTITTAPQIADLSLVQEKEQRIQTLTAEMKRLSSLEADSGRKEGVIHTLREEVADLQTRLRQRDTAADTDLTSRLLSLDDDVRSKKAEIHSLKDQIWRLQSDTGSPLAPSSPAPTSPASVSRQDLSDRVLEVNSLRQELERVRKDKNITSGLITQMQRDMANKDTTISRLTRDIDAVKKEMKEKEQQLTSMQAKFRRTMESKKADESLEAKDQELLALREKHREAEEKVTKMLSLTKALKEQTDKFKDDASTEKETQKKLQTDLDGVTAKCQDVERAERMVRVDLEQLSKRMSVLRSRVVAVAFSTPGVRAPDTELSDDEVVAALRRVVEERTEMYTQVTALRDAATTASQASKDSAESGRRLKTGVNAAVTRLREGGLTAARLRQESSLLSAVSVEEESGWVREGAVALLALVTAWQSDTEAALEAAGVNTRLSDAPPSEHITALYAHTTAARAETDDLRSQLTAAADKHRAEVTAATDAVRAELTATATAHRERLEIERDAEVERRVAEAAERSAETREEQEAGHRARVGELEAAIDSLKATLVSREDEEAANKAATKEALDAVQEYQKLEVELRGQLSVLQGSSGDEVSRLTAEVARLSAEREESESAAREHMKRLEETKRVTLVTLEGKINKAVSKNKDYQEEIAKLRATITDLRAKAAARPPMAPKPKVIVQKPAVDVVAMETTVLTLRRENADVKRQLVESSDVILGLRRDLAGASAKLSDVTGELSEGQKQAMESRQKTIHSQQVELVELRQQMAKLSEIIDTQASDIKQLTTDLSSQRSASTSSKSSLDQYQVRVKELEASLETERAEAKKNLKLVEEEGHITSELSSLGAQCRGERHDQVIARQREALSELRARIKALEQANPPLPSQDQALQQVVLLKKELSEIRASRALSESAGAQLSPLEHHIARARGQPEGKQADSDGHERSAHRETLEALELSEQSFLTLLRGVASSLELDNVAGLRTMSHIPKDERVRLAREREASVELLTSRIKVLTERISRKDELLQGYERDLAKLRQAEKLADQKHKQVEGLASDVRHRTEESQYLRESLQRTKERLDQEKRLNSNIKAKKTFHLENGQGKKGWSKHHCPPEDILGKDSAKKRATSERLKKKNYEIRTLKEELSTKDQSLHNARRKLVTLETSLGYESQRDPFEPPMAEVGAV